MILAVSLLALPTLQAPDATARGLRTTTPEAMPGYTLVAPLRSTSTYLIDLGGVTVHEWKSDLPPGQSVYLLDSGHLLRTERVVNETFRGGGQGGRIREMAWDGTVTWEYVLSDDTRCLHHDIKPLPNGNVLAIVWEKITREQALAAGRDPAQAQDLWADAVIEIEPVRPTGGKIVWEWHAFDHLVQERDAKLANYAPIASRPERLNIDVDLALRAPPAEAARDRERLKRLGYVGDDTPTSGERRGPGGQGGPDGTGARGDPASRDGRGGMDADWTHVNGIDWRADLDVIVLSSRTLSEIWVIDHSTTTAEAKTTTGGRYGQGGDLLFRFGNPRTHGGRPADQKLFVQHDPTWIADGRILMFNNGGLGHEQSSVDEYDLGLTAESLKKGFDPLSIAHVKMAWSYTSPDIHSSHISGAQRLANGNTLIAAGEPGLLREVDGEGRIVWDFASTLKGDLAPGGGRGRGGPPPGGPGDGVARGDGARNGPPPGDDGVPPPTGPGGERRGKGDGAPVQRGSRGGRGPGGGPDNPYSLFRAERYAPDHPGLRELQPTTGKKQ